jgi:hypothetical protein
MSGFIFKVTMRRTKPPVWRRIIVPEGITFGDLHLILQTVWGWEDEHMHTFRSAGCRIGPTGYGYEDIGDMDEDDTYVHDWLGLKYMDYIYDFGDSWEHRLVFEKENPEYDHPYARVLKFKGDNYEEDSGGIWEDIRIPFSLEETNQELQKLTFSRPETVSRSWENRKNEWMSFCQAWQEEEERGMMHADQPDWNDRGILTDLVFGQSLHTMEEIMADREVEKFCHFLCLPEEASATHEAALASFCTFLKEHPACMLYQLNREQAEYLVDQCQAQEGDELLLVCPQALGWALVLGLMEVTYEYATHKITAVIHFASDVLPLIRAMKPDWVRSQIGGLSVISERITVLMRAYGYLSVDNLARIYQNAYPDADMTEFHRVLNWRCSMNGEVERRKLVIDDGMEVPLVIAENLDLESISWKLREKYGSRPDVPSRRLFTAKEIDALVNDSTCEWQELRRLFHRRYDIYADRVIRVVHEGIMNGMEYSDLEDEIDIEPETPDRTAGFHEVISLWYSLVACLLRTPLPCYMGYSRIEQAEREGIDPFTLLNSPDVRQPAHPQNPFQLYGKDRKRLYQALETEDEQEAEQLEKKIPCLQGLTRVIRKWKKA